MLLHSLIIYEGGKILSMNSFFNSSYDVIEPWGSLASHFMTSPVIEKGKSLNLITSCVTPQYLNGEQMSMNFRRCSWGSLYACPSYNPLSHSNFSIVSVILNSIFTAIEGNNIAPMMLTWTYSCFEGHLYLHDFTLNTSFILHVNTYSSTVKVTKK